MSEYTMGGLGVVTPMQPDLRAAPRGTRIGHAWRTGLQQTDLHKHRNTYNIGRMVSDDFRYARRGNEQRAEARRHQRLQRGLEPVATAALRAQRATVQVPGVYGAQRTRRWAPGVSVSSAGATSGLGEGFSVGMPATFSLNSGDAPSPSYPTLRMAAAALAAYHGYKRNGSIGWAIVWAFLGSAFPIITVPVAFAQGLGQPKHRQTNRRRNRRRARGKR